MPSNEAWPNAARRAVDTDAGEMDDDQLEAVVGGQNPPVKDPGFGLADPIPVVVDPDLPAG